MTGSLIHIYYITYAEKLNSIWKIYPTLALKNSKPGFSSPEDDDDEGKVSSQKVVTNRSGEHEPHCSQRSESLSLSYVLRSGFAHVSVNFKSDFFLQPKNCTTPKFENILKDTCFRRHDGRRIDWEGHSLPKQALQPPPEKGWHGTTNTNTNTIEEK